MQNALVAIVVGVSFCLCGCVDEQPRTKLRPGVTFELHTVASAPSANTHPLNDPQTGMQLHLVDPPLITARNISTASVKLDEYHSVMLDVAVDSVGATTLAAATATPGMRIAIVVDGEIVSAPTVLTPIGSAFRVSGSNSQSDWERLVE